MKLPASFYHNPDVVSVARDLLGKILCTKIDGVITSGVITETEAYAGISDKASHAYGGRKTERNKVMYEPGGIAYIYLCYGIHSLFNVVTNLKEVPHAVLIRSVVAFAGHAEIRKRRQARNPKIIDLTGPGKVSQGLGLHYSMSGEKLTGTKIWIEDKGIVVSGKAIKTTPRIGVDYAGTDALLPYRFIYDFPEISH